MAIAIDKYGEVSMKLSDWEELSRWIKEKPEYLDLSFNEAVRLYVDEQKINDNKL